MAQAGPPAAAAPAALVPHADFSPLFPVEQWERDLEAHVKVVSDVDVQFNGIDAGVRRHGRWLSVKQRRVISNLIQSRLVPPAAHRAAVLADLVQDGLGQVGTALWHFAIERMTTDQLTELIPILTERQADAKIAAIRVELNRRTRRNEAGQTRDAMMQANLTDVFAGRNGGRDLMRLVTPMASGFVTQRRDPERPRETGPLPSNAEFLRRLMQQAQMDVAAAAVDPASAVDALTRLASQVKNLSDSVAKRARHE